MRSFSPGADNRHVRLRRPQHLGRAGAPQAAPPAQRAARNVHSGYYRWLRLSRLAMGAFVVLGVLFLAWAVPWLPSGLDADDYTPQLAFTVYLLGGAALTGVAALLLRELAFRNRERLMVWSTVYDETTGLHNRSYLYDWLALECDRARRNNAVFTVIALQIRLGGGARQREQGLSTGALRDLADALQPLLGPAGLIALVNAGELAIVEIGLGRDGRRAVAEQLRSAASAHLERASDTKASTDVRAGTATYGVDGSGADELVQAARTAAALALPPRSKVA